MEQIKHHYNDGNGRLLYTVVKFPNKEFRRLRQDQNGKEHWNWDGIKQVPYRWPDIKDHRAVIFVEARRTLTTFTALIWYLRQLLEEAMHGLPYSRNSLTSLRNTSADLIRSSSYQTTMRQAGSSHRKQADTSGSLYLKSG